MLDFGLARQYTTPTGEVRPPRPVAGFRGTVRYASVNTHLSKDLGRHDDIWSAFYMLVELATGQLPWRKFREKEEAGDFKAGYDHKKLIHGLPAEFLELLEHLQSLNYFQKPDYALVINLFLKAMRQLGVQECDPFDWEQDYSAPSVTTASAGSPPALKLQEEPEDEKRRSNRGVASGGSKTHCSEVEELSENGAARIPLRGGGGNGQYLEEPLQEIVVDTKQYSSEGNNIMAHSGPSLPKHGIAICNGICQSNESGDNRVEEKSDDRSGNKVAVRHHVIVHGSMQSDSLDKFFEARPRDDESSEHQDSYVTSENTESSSPSKSSHKVPSEKSRSTAPLVHPEYYQQPHKAYSSNDTTSSQSSSPQTPAKLALVLPSDHSSDDSQEDSSPVHIDALSPVSNDSVKPQATKLTELIIPNATMLSQEPAQILLSSPPPTPMRRYPELKQWNQILPTPLTIRLPLPSLRPLTKPPQPLTKPSQPPPLTKTPQPPLTKPPQPTSYESLTKPPQLTSHEPCKEPSQPRLTPSLEPLTKPHLPTALPLAPSLLIPQGHPDSSAHKTERDGEDKMAPHMVPRPPSQPPPPNYTCISARRRRFVRVH